MEGMLTWIINHDKLILFKLIFPDSSVGRALDC